MFQAQVSVGTEGGGMVNEDEVLARSEGIDQLSLAGVCGRITLMYRQGDLDTGDFGAELCVLARRIEESDVPSRG